MRDRQCALNHDATESAPIVSGVINKPTTVELCISPVYRRLAVAKFSKSTMTPVHYGRGSTACYRRPQTHLPPLLPIWCMTLSHFSGVKSRASGPLRQLLHLRIFWSDLPTASLTSLQLAVLKSSKSLRVCQRNPADLIRCLHG